MGGQVATPSNLAYIQAMESVKQGSTNGVLGFLPLHNFIQFFRKKPEVGIVTIGITKLVTECLADLQKAGALEAWQKMFYSLCKNLGQRKVGMNRSWKEMEKSRDLATIAQANSEQLQGDVIRNRKDKSSGDSSGFTRLSCFRPNTDPVLEKVQGVQNDVEMCLETLRGFLRNHGANMNFDFLEPDMKNLLNG